MAKKVKELKLSDSVLLEGEAAEYTGEGAIEVNNSTHKISAKDATDDAKGVVTSGANVAISGGALAVNLDKAATAAGKTIPEMTIGEIFAALGATTEPLPTSGFRVNGTDYTTFADAVAALRNEATATLELFEDVAISASETYPSGSANTAGLVFCNRSKTDVRNYTVNGHGHKITLSTFAADGILVAGYAADMPKSNLNVAFRNFEVVCSDANVFRAFQCSNATVSFENVTANSKKKNIIGINGAVITIDGATLTYDGGWEPIGLDNGTGTDGASCTFNSGSVTGLPSDKAFANVENGHGTVSQLVVTGGQFDTLPTMSSDAGAAIEISGGRFKVAVTQNLCAAGYVPHDYDDGEYRYGVIAG